MEVCLALPVALLITKPQSSCEFVEIDPELIIYVLDHVERVHNGNSFFWIVTIRFLSLMHWSTSSTSESSKFTNFMILSTYKFSFLVVVLDTLMIRKERKRGQHFKVLSSCFVF